MPMPPPSWTGWSRRTPRRCGCISTGPAPAGSEVTRPPSPIPTRRATDSPGRGRTTDATDGDYPPEPVIAEPGDHAIGRSRGGLTTKVHALSDGAGRLLVVVLTAGNVHDSPVFGQLLAGLRVARPGAGRARTRPDSRGRQGLQLPGQPRTAARPPDRAHHCGEGRPGRLPSPQGLGGRPATCLRPRPLRPSQQRRTRLLPAQTVARPGHPL